MIKELLNFGILVINKPEGPTSFSVSNYVMKKLELKKTSHFGTLDPAVTGVLPVALGRAVKLTGFFLGHDKEYIGVMHVHKEIPLKYLQKIINEKFTGRIMQIPPVKSRVKREKREREIKSFELLEQEEKDFLFKAEVQGGTYIRKLVHDVGLAVGGAHMAELRRIRAGIFDESNIVNLYDFDKAVELWKLGDESMLRKMIIPAEDAIKKIIPEVQAKDDIKKLLTGKPIFREDVEKIPESELFSVFSGKKFIEIAKKVNEGNIIGRPEFVYN